MKNVLKEPANVLPEESVDSIADNKSIEFLKSTLEPFDLVKKHWRLSFAKRKQIIDKQDFSIDSFFDDFKSLKSSNGFKLIQIDFEEMYPEKNDALVLKWNSISKKIVQLLRKKEIISSEEISNIGKFSFLYLYEELLIAIYFP